MSNRKKKILSIINFLLISLLAFVNYTHALEVQTHRSTNEYIAKNNSSGFSLNDFLIKQLGMPKGYDEKMVGKEVYLWISDGGAFEDKPSGCVPYWRSKNHFHNPIDNSGFSGIWDTGFLKGMSVIDWINQPVNTQGCGYYSWNDARKYYEQALTATDKTTRETNFAETFRALGQTMHLVQDMSVPEHTRNDGHYFAYDYEKWMDEEEHRNTIANYVPVISFAHDDLFSLNVKNLFDTDQYLKGTAPTITTSSNRIGLSEYTNANFFSGDTINAANFPYPKTDSNKKAIMPYTGPEATYDREYFRKDCSEAYCQASASKNYSGYLLSAVDLNDYWRMQNPDSSEPLPVIPVLDENVHYDYSQFLIPRAIGYSSQLLQYFFRGQMKVQCLPVIVENKIIYVKLTIKNGTLGEAMTNGILMLTGKYMDSNDQEKLVKAYYWNQSEGKSSEYAVIQSLNYDQSSEELRFFFPSGTEIPVNKWDSIKLTLTYKGKLGNEEGAVIGKVFSSGNLSFNEEFNTAPKGDYNWFQMDSAVFGSNVWDGVAQNEIVGGKLIKTNVLSATNTGIPWHYNTSMIGAHNLLDAAYANNIFPIPITQNTYIEFKIDSMTITPIAAQEGNYQGMVLSFNNGYKLELSLNNQLWYLNNTTGYFSFDVGNPITVNIHKMFQQCNLPVPADIKLDYIGLFQKIALSSPNAIPYEQKMTVDFIRIVEMLNTGY